MPRILIAMLMLLYPCLSFAGAAQVRAMMGMWGSGTPSGTSVSDDFSGTGALSANWTATPSQTVPVRNTDQVRPTSISARNGAYYSGATFADNQKACADIIANTGASASVTLGVGARIQSGSQGGYYVLADDDTATERVYIKKLVAGTFTNLSTFTQSIPSNICIKVSGSGASTVITPVFNGVDQTSYTDTSGTFSSGYPGMFLYVNGTQSDAKLDNFTGSDL